MHSDYEFIFCCSKRSHIIWGKSKKFRTIRNNNFIIILTFCPIFIFVILYSCYRHINLWCTVYNNINIDNTTWKININEMKTNMNIEFLCYSIAPSFQRGYENQIQLIGWLKYQTRLSKNDMFWYVLKLNPKKCGI